jgi:hypothetical protein
MKRWGETELTMASTDEPSHDSPAHDANVGSKPNPVLELFK